jgi:hypothetical protein
VRTLVANPELRELLFSETKRLRTIATELRHRRSVEPDRLEAPRLIGPASTTPEHVSWHHELAHAANWLDNAAYQIERSLD